MRKSFVLGLLALIGWSGCSTDFQVAGEYQELAVVYGLLDPDSTTQYLRIQKAFLGELSAEEMAQTRDSSYFDPETMVAVLNEYNENDDLLRVISLDTVTVQTKEEETDGFAFFAPTQRLYKTDEALVEANEYEILLNNTATGYRDSARIDLVRPSAFSFRNPSQNNLNTSKKMILFLGNGLGYRDYSIKLNSMPNAYIYEIWLHFDYQEERTVNGVTTLEPKTLSWQVQRFSFDESPNGVVEAVFSGESWFRFVGSSLEPEAGLVRRIGLPDITDINDPNWDTDNFSQDLRIEVICGGKELRDYLNINAPSNSGALTDKPAYSTLSTGRGFISSRSFKWYPGNIHLDTDARDQLMGGQFTSDLGFGEY